MLLGLLIQRVGLKKAMVAKEGLHVVCQNASATVE